MHHNRLQKKYVIFSFSFYLVLVFRLTSLHGFILACLAVSFLKDNPSWRPSSKTNKLPHFLYIYSFVTTTPIPCPSFFLFFIPFSSRCPFLVLFLSSHLPFPLPFTSRVLCSHLLFLVPFSTHRPFPVPSLSSYLPFPPLFPFRPHVFCPHPLLFLLSSPPIPRTPFPPLFPQSPNSLSSLSPIPPLTPSPRLSPFPSSSTFSLQYA